jgi:choline dehydrogenase-like flavoprotein
VTVQISDRERQTWAHAQAVGRRIADAVGARQVTSANGMFQWCHHHMGTCRMGRDAQNSVVDRDLRVHDLDNLYVSGSATFVTGSVGSPTLLLTALTLRLADHLAARLGHA